MFSPPTIRDDATGSPILVKHASGNDRALLRRQAKLLEAAAHLNVVQLRSLLELEERSELMLTYVQGAPLGEHPPLTLEALLDVVLQLGDTLVALQELGIAHGAIAAEHVLIDKHGRVVLCGFGNAEFADAELTGTGLAGTGHASTGHASTGDHLSGLAALLESELARSEDAGLTTTQRRETAEVHSAIALAVRNGDKHGGEHGGEHGDQRYTSELGQLRPGVDLRSWLAHLLDVADTVLVATGHAKSLGRGLRSASNNGQAAGGRSMAGRLSGPGRSAAGNRSAGGRLSGPGRSMAGGPSAVMRRWRLLAPTTKRWLLVGVVALAGFVVWQVRTSAAPVAVGSALTDGVLGASAGTGNLAGGAQAGANQPGANQAGGSQTGGVLLMGVTPERCFDGSAGAETSSATGTDGAGTAGTGAADASTVISTVHSTVDLDINGDGCDDHVRIGIYDSSGQPAIATDTRRWLIGQPGDLVAVGDWNCDGLATPALVRPVSGEAFVFVVWPYTDPPTQPTFRAVVPQGATGVMSAPLDTAEAGESGRPGGSGRQCHDLAITYADTGTDTNTGTNGNQTLRLSPTRSWSAVELRPLS